MTKIRLQICLFILNLNLQAQGLILSEVMVDPVCGNDDCEFVELKNQSGATIDISSWKVSDGEAGINEWTATFPGGTTLDAWEFVIVTKNLSAFEAEYGAAACAIFQITNVGSGAGLANGGDNINLINPSGVTVQSYVWGGSVDRAVYNGSTWSTTTGGDDGDPCVSAVLPIILVEFKASFDQSVHLAWRTATEISNDFFAVERSADGSNFIEIGRVKGAGTAVEPNNYTFTDESPLPGLNFYRLRQVDFDGQYTYSWILTVQTGQQANFRLFPSPTTGLVHLQFDKPAEETTRWEILDCTGRQLHSGVIFTEQVDLEIDVTDLPAGIYNLRIKAGRETTAQRFLKSQ